ncbi:MAG TPA: glycosyltransferase family 4 protein [Vicinamibacteria bacterium]|jgi:glycosyltransferase involved in cell wall biosynthesis
MTSPRIAVVAPSLDIVGGQGVQAHALVEGLRRDGWDAVLIPINPDFPAGLRWVRGYPYARTVLNEALYLPSLRGLRDADAVHVFSASYWSFLLAPAPAMAAARRWGKRVVLHYHSGEAEDHLGRWGRRVHPWLRLADEIVVPSEYLREVFARHGYRTRVIPNVVDTSAFRFRPRRPLRPHFVSTRNFEAYYRVDNTLEAFAIVKRRHPHATLALAGYGSLEGQLRERTSRLGLADVRFCGRVAPRDMPGLYDEADIFLNSSVLDNQPVSVLEAFAAGLPVISTGTGDISRMLRHGDTGLVVSADDPGGMAAAATDLLADPDRALQMAQRARREAEKYTWPAVREAWTAAYLAGARTARRAG